jgi:hypothetical protein
MAAICLSGAIFSLCYIEHNAGSIFSYFCFNCAQILPLVEAFESIKFNLVRKSSGLITYVVYISPAFSKIKCLPVFTLYFNNSCVY